jgi:hypothetical protein
VLFLLFQSRVEEDHLFDMAKDSNKSVEEVNGVPTERQGPRPDFSTPPPRKQLPKEIQDTLNDEEKLWEVLYDGEYVHLPPTLSPPNTFFLSIRTLHHIPRYKHG